MYSIAGDERIIERFRNLMAVSGDISESAAEDAGADPTGVVHDEASFGESIAGVSEFEIIGVEAEDAAVGCGSDIKKGVGEEESRDVLGGNVARKLGGADGGAGIQNGRKQEIHESVGVNEDVTAADPARQQRECVFATWDTDGTGGLNTGIQKSVPVRLGALVVFGTLNCICELCGDIAAAVIRYGEDGRIECRLNERGDVIVETDGAVEVQQIQRNRDDGSIDDSGSAELGWITRSIGVPMSVGVAVGIEAVGEVLSVEVGERIDAEDPESSVAFAIQMTARSDGGGSGMCVG
ncbi:MAG: hypothetical protein JWO20_250 [Candidatus Angelobacter sp.]|nr:hypothetical protein [Candidatus Angelobacter sp.]